MQDSPFWRRALALLRRTPNRGYTHLFLGDPLSDGCDKTTVEPGNVFSPGVWTCGIEVWVEIGGELFAPSVLPDDAIEWYWESDNSFVPILRARYNCGPHLQLENRLTHSGGQGSEGADFCAVTLTAKAKAAGWLYVVVRDVGPAGGKINHLQWNGGNGYLELDGGARLTPETAPDNVQIAPPDEEFDSPVALLGFGFTLTAGQTWQIGFTCQHAFTHRAFGGVMPLQRPHAQTSVQTALNDAVVDWKAKLPTRIFAPDARIEAAWKGCAYHLLAAMECGLPRIGAVNYPIFWIRDGVLVLRALDAIGCSALARRGCDYLAPLDFGGGFGAESDAPSEGIWALCRHAQMSGDTSWLREIFPHLRRRVKWIEAMLATNKPLHQLSENRLPRYQHTPGINLLCFAAQNGLIHGRMDWHSPDFYINCWALCGLREAVWAARALGEVEFATQWENRAQQLNEALREYLLPAYGNPRDPAVTPHPTGALAQSDTERVLLREKFADWYRAHRLDAHSERQPEPLWTYFEAAQIHNAILLGLCDEAWINLDGMLDDGARYLWAYGEGTPGGHEFLPFENGNARRGWLNEQTARAGNMPHNWTGAELILALRSLFVIEENNVLRLGAGVPPSWLQPGCEFGVQNLPTALGPVSYTAKVDANGAPHLDYQGPPDYRVEFIM